MNQSEPTYNGLPQSSVVNNNRVSSPSYSVHRQHHYHARQQRRQSRSISPIDYRQKAVYYQQERSSRHYSPNRPIRRDPNTYYPVSTRSPSPPRYSRRSPSPIRYKQAAHHHYQRPSLNHSPPNKIGYSNGSVYFENPPENKVLAVFGLGRTCQPSDLMRAFHKYNCYDCKIIIDKRTMRPRGFGFVYFNDIQDAIRAKKEMHDRVLLDKRIRVDFSVGEKTTSHRDHQQRQLYRTSSRSRSRSYRSRSRVRTEVY